MRIKWTKEYKDFYRMEQAAKDYLKKRGLLVSSYHKPNYEKELADFDYSSYIEVKEYSAEVVSTIVIDNKPHFVYVFDDGTFGNISIEECKMDSKQ